MAKIIVSKAAQFGIQGITKSELSKDKLYRSEKYKELVTEADKRIEENRFQYARAYKKAATYLAR